MVFSNSIVFTKIDYGRARTAGTEAGTGRGGRQGEPGVCATQDGSGHVNQTSIAGSRRRQAQARRSSSHGRHHRSRGLGFECIGQATVGIAWNRQDRTAIGGIGRPAICAPVLGLRGHGQ